MDGLNGIYRRIVWCIGCLCVVSALAPGAHAATRKHVNMPSAQTSISSPTATATKSGSNVTTEVPLEGEYIPSDYSGSKGTKLPVKSRTDHSIPRTINHVKNGIRGGLAGVISAVAFGYLLDEIGGFIDENGQPVKPGEEAATTPSSYWCAYQSPSQCNGTDYWRVRRLIPDSFYNDHVAFVQASNPAFVGCSYTVTTVTSTTVGLTTKMSNNGCATITSTQNFTLYRLGSCEAGYTYSESKRQCVRPGAPMPLTDADYQLLEQAAIAKDSPFIRDLIKQTCEGSLNPSACFDDIADNPALTGPATLQGPTTNSTTNWVDGNGVAHQTITNNRVDYKITYGPTYYDYSKKVTTTKTTDGQQTEQTTEEETEEVTDEETPPKEEQQEDPVLCQGQNCDGPAYVDLYDPTDTTKEDALDSYQQRLAAVPIIQAVGGLFDVSVSGSCPVWSYHDTFTVGQAAMPIDLTFDHLCQPWFTQYGPWIRAVVYLVGIALAIRVALL